MPIESDNRLEVKFNPTAGIPKTSYNEKSTPTAENITWFSTVQPNSLGRNKKEETMTENTPTETGFEIKETVINKGYVDAEGKFHAVDAPAAFVQVGEDA